MKSNALKVLFIGLLISFSSIILPAQSAQPERVKVGNTTLFKKDCSTVSKNTTCTLCEDSKLKVKCQQYKRKSNGSYSLFANPQLPQSARAKRPIKVKEDPDGGGEVSGK